MAEYKLELKGICKSFPGVKALDNVQLSVRPGTVHALMGENGAGKSTLMKCLFGIYKMDAGEIYLDGEKIDIKDPDDAMSKGIAMVHQELQPVLARSVGENLFLGRFPTKNYGPLKVIDHKKMYEDTKMWLDEVGMDFDPKAQLGSLSIGQMQSVEIAKAVSHQAKVVIFDEPTSSLSDKEVDALFRIMNDLRSKGVAMIYISHKMKEILRISDDVTIMRDGQWIATKPAKDLTMNEIIKLMVGRELTNLYPEKDNVVGEPLLEVKGLTAAYSKLRDVSFVAKKGEVLGIAGLDGSGRTELLENIFGIATRKEGEIYLHGKRVMNRNARESIKNKFALLTEERRATGIFGIRDIQANTTISSFQRYKVGPFLSDKKMSEATEWGIKAMRTKTPSQRTQIRSLSGGNQQKVILARWLLTEPEVLLLDEPTRGIDVGAKALVLDALKKFNRENGVTVVMISSELEELRTTCDRIAIVSGGRIVGILPATESSETFGALMVSQVK